MYLKTLKEQLELYTKEQKANHLLAKILLVKIMWEILHWETGVACSRNSLLSLCGRLARHCFIDRLASRQGSHRQV
jgi:hypothetical protein